jgi:SAM-dependent methyltransferase
VYPWFHWVFDAICSVAPADARILEVGAGPGGLWRENTDRLPAEWRVTLTDLSEGMVREQQTALAQPAFTCQLADVEALPFADASYDVVVANHMLYHVPDRPRALGELRRVLRPGGRIVAATNGEGNMRELDELVYDVVPDDAARRWKSTFRLPFTLENGAEQLQPFFQDIETLRYDDGLDVTEAEPLVAYMLSIDAPEFREPGVMETLQARADALLQQHSGVFHITKDVGLFLGRRAD